MSVVFSLTAVGVAMGVTAISGSLSVISAFSEHRQGEREIAPIETRFSDVILLRKTLSEHGFSVTEEADGQLIVRTNVGALRFFVSDQSSNYWVQAFDLVNEEELAGELGEVHDEYMLNVQKNNYILLKQQVSERNDMMIVSEEILEDDSILLTIDI